jgi:hypothetical protein
MVKTKKGYRRRTTYPMRVAPEFNRSLKLIKAKIMMRGNKTPTAEQLTRRIDAIMKKEGLYDRIEAIKERIQTRPRMNQRGQMLNYIAAILFIFIMGISVLFGYLLFYNFNQEFASTSQYTEDVQTAAESFNAGLIFFDYFIGIIAFIMVIGIGITTYRLASAPIFFILTFAMAGVLGFMGYILSYISGQFVQEPMVATILAFFPITLLITTNLHWVMLLIIVIGSITLYGKSGRGQFINQ